MENASKALIIAGAILISILLISIGIIVINSINSPLAQAEEEGGIMSAQMFNSKYTQYMGEQNGKTVKKLVEMVEVNNLSRPEHLIAIVVPGGRKNVSQLKDDQTFNVKIEDLTSDLEILEKGYGYHYGPDGYIDFITVTAK